MGLLKAAQAAAGTTLANQWLEFVTPEQTGANVLVQRAYPKQNGSNTKSNVDVLTNGTRISVPEGMAMMIVDQGKITEFTAEAGEFTYDSSTEPSVFYGGFGKGIVNSFKKFADSFKFGGEPPKDQRVYYINIKEIMGLKFGTAEPMPYPDPKYDITLYIRFYGTYSIKVADPAAFISNLIGTNPADVVTIQSLEQNGQFQEEFMTSLVSGLAQLAHQENISFSELPRYQKQLAKCMNDELDEDWIQKRGIEVVSVAIPSVSLTDESQEDVRKYDEIHIAEKHGQGTMTAAAAAAMRDAAKNESGMSGAFMGMNVGSMMANQMGNVTGAVFANKEEDKEQTTANVWKCPNCGKENDGKFCSECGMPKPKENKCPSCGNVVDPDAKFCPNCGQKIGE